MSAIEKVQLTNASVAVYAKSEAEIGDRARELLALREAAAETPKLGEAWDGVTEERTRTTSPSGRDPWRVAGGFLAGSPVPSRVPVGKPTSRQAGSQAPLRPTGPPLTRLVLPYKQEVGGSSPSPPTNEGPGNRAFSSCWGG
jgi:hypothetical protein